MLPTIEVPGVGLSLRSYWVMVVLGVFVACLGSVYLAKRLEGISPRATVSWLCFLLAGALIGGWLEAALAGSPAFVEPTGLLIGLALAVPIAFWAVDAPAGRFADAVIPAFALGMSIARVGCFLNGCCWGLRSNLPWCVQWGDQCRHPFQLYFVSTALVLAVATVALRPFRRFEGEIALGCVSAYALVAALLEPMRYAPPSTGTSWLGLGLPKERTVWFGVASLGVVLIVAGEMTVSRARRGRHGHAAPPTA